MLGTFYTEFVKRFESSLDESISGLVKRTREVSIDDSTLDTFLTPFFSYATGGKRIRPYLIAVGSDSLEEKVIQAGVAFELFHTFILMHDDIMDGARVRRGVPSAHIAFKSHTPHGKWAAMVLGDFLMASANEHLFQYAPELGHEFFEMQRLLCVGQYYELLHWGQDVTRETSERIEYFKSAQYTFMYPLRLGLMLVEHEKTLFDDYAKNAGLAFQMRDDWLDVSGSEAGKDIGLDAQNEVPNTVQHLYRLNSGDMEKTRLEVRDLLASYRDEGLMALSREGVTLSQKQNLTRLLQYVTNI